LAQSYTRAFPTDLVIGPETKAKTQKDTPPETSSPRVADDLSSEESSDESMASDESIEELFEELLSHREPNGMMSEEDKGDYTTASAVWVDLASMG
jgi:hypothetical protein